MARLLLTMAAHAYSLDQGDEDVTRASSAWIRSR
jgi:hypothetical protein